MIVGKPLNYIRDFKGGILDNKLKYCIIKDINIDYSCVACCVGVGSRKDPKEFHGLAHFLEHMLFLGSKKYPDSEYFNDFISPLQQQKDKLFEELKGRIKLADQSTYTKKDDYFYYSRTEENKDYAIYCRKFGSTDAKEEILLDVRFELL